MHAAHRADCHIPVNEECRAYPPPVLLQQSIAARLTPLVLLVQSAADM